jgi:uncharacterized protein (DUF488 family)
VPVLTIGHSTHEAQAFAELLGAHAVDLLVDVRRHPGSRRVPWTNPGVIERALPVEYLHLPELGGRRKPAADSQNGLWRNASFRGYADHMASAEFANGLERLVALGAAELRPVVMCAEGLWWRCHRRLIADALVARGVDVLHIDTRGGLQPHTLTEGAVVADGRAAYPPAQGALG